MGLIKVYVAGPLNGPDAPSYIENLSKMLKVARDIRRLGFAVFVPGQDFLLGLIDGNFDYSDYFHNGIEWLRVSDFLFVINLSPGVKKEIKVAKKLGIPIVHSIDELLEKAKELKTMNNYSKPLIKYSSEK